MDNETAKEFAKQASGVLEKAYDDALHPSAASIGDTASLIPRTVGCCSAAGKCGSSTARGAST